MRNKGEVEVHTSEPMNFLLCGRRPIISRARRRSVAHSVTSEQIDTSRFPPVIPHYSKTRPNTQFHGIRIRRTEKNPMTSYKKLKSEETTLTRAQGYLQTYSDNHERKTFQIHQDWEDRYMRPLLTEMKHKLNGRGYTTFRETRRRAETALGVRSPYNALSDIEAASLPSVHLSTGACDDRITLYKKHAEHDARLTKIIKDSQGIVDPPKKFKDRVTCDPEAWRLIPDSRVYGRDANGESVRKGRRSFPDTYRDRIEQTLSQFPAPC